MIDLVVLITISLMFLTFLQNKKYIIGFHLSSHYDA